MTGADRELFRNLIEDLAAARAMAAAAVERCEWLQAAVDVAGVPVPDTKAAKAVRALHAVK